MADGRHMRKRPGPSGPGRFVIRALLSITLLFAIPPEAVQAQTRADSAAVILDAARRLSGDRSVSATLLRYIVDRYAGTPAAAEAARILAESNIDDSGRVELQVWGTLFGLGLGVAVPIASKADGVEPFGIGLLTGGPVGFFASRAYARSRSLSEGQARAITLGGTWGAWQGLGWALVADVGHSTERICPDPQFPTDCFDVAIGDTEDEVALSVIAGGVAGIAVGTILSRKPIDRGLATTVNFGALWGTWFGTAAGVLADQDGEDELLRAALIGGDAGLLATAILAPRWHLTRERARLISIAGVLGGLAGAGIDLLLQPRSEDITIGIPLVTSIAGLALGALTTRGGSRADARDDSVPDLPMPTLLRVQGADGRAAVAPGMVYTVRF